MAVERFEFRLEGVQEMERTLKLLPEKVAERELRRALRAGGRVVRKAVIDSAPRSGSSAEKRRKRSTSGKDYGALHENIRVTTRTKGKRNSAEVAVHTGNAFWGLFLEFGTVKMAARPFFTPAWDRSAPEALNKIGETLARGIDRTAAELALRSRARLTRSTRRLL